MFINNPKPSQEEANDEMVWHNNLLAADSSTTSTSSTAGFAPASHNGFDHEWNKSVNLQDFCQTAQTNNPTSSFVHNPYQFDPSSTSHLGVSMDMDMMTSFNTSFDSSNMSSPSAGATWSESSPEYETRRQHEAQDSSTSTNSTTSGSFHRPSTTESSSNNGNGGNDAQSFPPMSDASWGSSPAPQIQGSYMDFSDTTGTATTTSAAMSSPINSSSISAIASHPQPRPQHRQHEQPTAFSQQNFSDASGSFETDGLFDNVTSTPPHQQMPADFAVWSSGAPSSRPSITLASSPFVSHNQAQAEPRWRALHEYSLTGSVEPMMDEPRLTSSSSLSLVDNMSEGGGSSMSVTGMPSSPITNPFQNTSAGGVTGHHSLAFDGLPSPTHSSLGFGRQGSSGSGGGGVSLQHQQQQQNQFPSVMLNGGQLAASGDPFGSTGDGGNFSHPSSSLPNNGGEILFRGPISHRTVFDYPPPLGPSHGLDHDSSPILKSEGPLSVSPSSLWMTNNHQQQHKSQPPHSSPDSSPIGANTFFGTQQNQQMPSLPLDFGVNNAQAQFGNGHFNNQLHPHYIHQQQQQQGRGQRKSLPHTPPRRVMGMGMGIGNGGGGCPPSPGPRYNNNHGVMTTREMLPSHSNHPSWGHHEQGHPHSHGLQPPHHHQQLMIKPNTLPSQRHPQYHPSMSSHRRNNQPFHEAHPYHLSSSPHSSNNKRRGQGHGNSHHDSATDSIKRARAEQDALLVKLRKQGKSYKQIRQIGKFTEAESTLRGRYRTLTKSREERVRRPEWTDKDLRLLERAVRTLKKGPLAVTYSNPSTNSRLSTASSSTSTPGPGGPAGDQAISITSLVSSSKSSSSAAGTSRRPSSTTNSRNRSPSQSSTQSHPGYQQPVPELQPQPRGIPTTTTKVPWKQVSHYIYQNGGTYKFGNATVRKRWEGLMRTELAKGKNLDKPFYEQRSKRSPYNLQEQAGTSASFSSRISLAGGGGGSARGQGRRSVAEQDNRAVKRERERKREDHGEANLAYSDWLDMSALGDDADADENNGDGDEDHDISDAEDDDDDDDDDDDEEEDDEENEDSDGDYMEE